MLAMEHHCTAFGEKIGELMPVRPLLSLKETTCIAEVSEDAVRKDLERKVVARPIPDDEKNLSFGWAHVPVFRAVYSNAVLTKDQREVAYRKMITLVDTSFNGPRPLPAYNSSRVFGPLLAQCRLDLGDYFFIDLARVCADVLPRVELYAWGLSRTNEDREVAGGEAVFKNSRLPVRHIGKMFSNGAPLNEILEDYPYLSERDVTFAKLYFEAHPPTGRPRKAAEKDHGRIVAR